MAILTTVVRKSTKRELKIFQRTMRKIKGEATLRRIAADCKLIEGKEWMSEEIDAYFKAKRRAMVMQPLGNDDFSGGEDEDEDPSSSSRREAAAASSRESFNAKEEEIRRRLKRYENEELRTSTRSEQTVTVNSIPEVPRMVKCVSSDGSFEEAGVTKTSKTTAYRRQRGKEERIRHFTETLDAIRTDSEDFDKRGRFSGRFESFKGEHFERLGRASVRAGKSRGWNCEIGV